MFGKCHSALGPFHLHVFSCLHTLLVVATGADDVQHVPQPVLDSSVLLSISCNR
jgi:hypothetical protein